MARHPALKHRCPVCRAAVGNYCLEVETPRGTLAKIVCLERIPDAPPPTIHVVR